MMAIACAICDAPLRLLREHWDDLDKVFVGELECPLCGREYLDTRSPKVPRPAPSKEAP